MVERLRRWAEWGVFVVLGLLGIAGPALIAAGFLWRSPKASVAGLILFLAVGLLVWKAPTILMRVFNRTVLPRPHELPEPARTLHESLLVMDLHADTMMWERDFLARDARGHVDLPRMIAGNLAIEVFTATTRAPIGMNFDYTPDTIDMLMPLAMLQGWPRRTWASPYARARHMGDRLNHYADHSGGKFRILRNRQDIDEYVAARQSNRDMAAGILGIQGAHALEGKLEHVDRLFEAGFRLAGLTHFFDNEVGGSAHGVAKMGLTDFGREAVPRMQQLGMVVDLAHAAPRLIDDVLAIASAPVIASHTGPKGAYDTSRTLSDAHLRAIAASGGVIGIGFWGDAIGPGGISAIVRAICYTADVAGVEHVALGSDYDGMTAPPFDCSGLGLITRALREAGCDDAFIRAVMGENAVRVFRRCLPERHAPGA